MTAQERADRAEAAALQRYRSMRKLWAPCWGRTAARVERRPAQRRAGVRRQGPARPPTV